MKPMLARDYDGRNPTGLWISEKFDGVRAVWTGKELLTRAGNRIDCPAWFTEGLPSVALDGELWAGRGKFQVAKGMAQSIGRDKEWAAMRFEVFDMPGPQKFEERRIRLAVITLPPHCLQVFQFQCTDARQLAREFEQVKRDGGEGLMLRIPGSPYLFGQRSAYWLKLKREPRLYKVAA